MNREEEEFNRNPIGSVFLKTSFEDYSNGEPVFVMKLVNVC